VGLVALAGARVVPGLVRDREAGAR
jgi:hypothetical protein